jgi:hypothetical protein
MVSWVLVWGWRELTIWIDNREQIEIILVHPGLCLGVGGVVTEEDIGKVFDSLCAMVSK